MRILICATPTPILCQHQVVIVGIAALSTGIECIETLLSNPLRDALIIAL
jgi:hypothetical protein